MIFFDQPSPIAYFTLKIPSPEPASPTVLGAIRLKRSSSSSRFNPREKELTLALTQELAVSIYHMRLHQKNQEQLKRLSVLTELTGVFATSLRMEDRLKLILQGIQQHFGFDRVRLYLVDTQQKKLRGELSADIRGQVQPLREEEWSLQQGTHRLVNIVLGQEADPILDRYRDTIIYLPLRVQGKVTGLLVLDNLLSQEPIHPEDISLIRSFAGQIAMAVDNARLFKEVEELSLYDGLTQLPLRRYFLQRFQEEIYRAERFHQPLALVMLDVDFFKQVNDTYGHQIGDKLLVELSKIILANIRKIDFPARYCGDEVLILLPQAGEEESKMITTRLAQQIKEIAVPVPFARVKEVRVTSSMGIAIFPQDASSVEGLIDKADDALYWVKSHGRDGICFYRDISASSRQGSLFE